MEFKEFSEGFEVDEPDFDINNAFSGSSSNDPEPEDDSFLEEETLDSVGEYSDNDWQEIPEDTDVLDEETFDFENTGSHHK